MLGEAGEGEGQIYPSQDSTLPTPSTRPMTLQGKVRLGRDSRPGQKPSRSRVTPTSGVDPATFPGITLASSKGQLHMDRPRILGVVRGCRKNTTDIRISYSDIPILQQNQPPTVSQSHIPPSPSAPHLPALPSPGATCLPVESFPSGLPHR